MPSLLAGETPALRRCAVVLMLAGAALAGGCAKTVGPDEFLIMYRQSVPAGMSDRDVTATYNGKEDGYQYIQFRRRTPNDSPAQLLLWGGFRDQTYRCQDEQLPDDFPQGFLRAFEDGVSQETDTASRRYVQQYLHEHGR